MGIPRQTSLAGRRDWTVGTDHGVQRAKLASASSVLAAVSCLLLLGGGAVRPAAAVASYADRHGNPARHDWSVLIEHDCDGSLHFLPSMPEMTVTMGVDGRFNRLFATVRDRTLDQIRCHCPALGEADLARFFDPSVAGILNVLQNTNFTKTQLDEICTGAATNFTHSLATLSELAAEHGVQWNNTEGANVHIPTCTAANYATTGCRAAHYSMGETVQVAVRQCPNADGTGNDDSKLPYFVLGCEGALCMNMFRPCRTDADCARGGAGGRQTNMTCDPLSAIITGNRTDDHPIPPMLEDLMATAKLYTTGGVDAEGSRPALVAGQQQCAAGLGDSMLSALMGTLGAMMGNMAGASGATNMCGMKLMHDTMSGIAAPTTDNIRPWDGVLANGDNAFDDFEHRHLNANIDPEALVTPECQASYDAGEVVPIVERQCRGVHGGAGAVLITPLSPFRMGIQPAQFQKFIEGVVMQWFKSIVESCSDPIIDVAKGFYVWQPGFWLNLATRNAPWTGGLWEETGRFDSISQMLQLLLDGAFGGTFTVSLPETCTMAEWESTGTCRMQFSNLTSLLGWPAGSLTLRMTISQCTDEPESIPYIYMDCVGSSCKRLFEIYNVDTCVSDADCITGTSCSSFEDVSIVEGGAGLVPTLLWGAGAEDTCGSSAADVFSVIAVVRSWGSADGTAVPFTPSEKSARSVCLPSLEGEGTPSAEDFFGNLVHEAASRTYAIRGLDSWQPAPAGDDGCALGIKAGDASMAGTIYRVTVPTEVAVSTLEITFLGDLTTMQAETKEDLKTGVRATVIAVSQGKIQSDAITDVVLTSGSILATVVFAPNAVSRDDTADIVAAVQSPGGLNVSVNGIVYPATGISVSSQESAAEPDAEGTGAIVAGTLCGIVAVALMVAAAVYHKRGAAERTHPSLSSAKGARTNAHRRNSYGPLKVENMEEVDTLTCPQASLIAPNDGEEEHPVFEQMQTPGVGPSAVEANKAAEATSFAARGDAFKSVRRSNPLAEAEEAPPPVFEDVATASTTATLVVTTRDQ